MPDITMCSGQDCPLKSKCHRFTAEPLYMQSYFVDPPYNKEKDNCDMFWGPNQESILNQLNDIVNGNK